MNTALIFEILIGYLRHLLTGLGVYLVSSYGVDATSWEAATGAILTLAGLAASAYDKYSKE